MEILKDDELKIGRKVLITYQGKPYCNDTIARYPVPNWPGFVMLQGVEEPVHKKDLRQYMKSGIIDPNERSL